MQTPAATANHLWTEHAGLTLTVAGGTLVPVTNAAASNFTDVALTAVNDTATPARAKQAPAALTRNSNNVNS